MDGFTSQQGVCAGVVVSIVVADNIHCLPHIHSEQCVPEPRSVFDFCMSAVTSTTTTTTPAPIASNFRL